MTVTVIVLNFNGVAEDFLPACLDSLCRQSYPRLQLIVVDNASRDDSAQHVSKRANIELVRSDEPLGFGQANNLGFLRAAGDFVMFANHDTVFEPDCIERLIEAVDLGSDIGMVAPKLQRPTRGPEKTLDSAGTLLRRDFTMYDRGFGVPDIGQFESAAYVFAPCGAAAFFRRTALEEVRHADGTLWDEDFFYYYEDGDLGWRVRNAGWRCLYYPKAIALHHRGATMAPKFFGKTHSFKVHTIKNRYLMIAKNAPAIMLAINLPFLLARELLIFGYLVMHPSLLADVWRAMRASWRRAIEKRRSSTLSGSEIGLFRQRPLSGERVGRD